MGDATGVEVSLEIVSSCSYIARYYFKPDTHPNTQTTRFSRHTTRSENKVAGSHTIHTGQIRTTGGSEPNTHAPVRPAINPIEPSHIYPSGLEKCFARFTLSGFPSSLSNTASASSSNALKKSSVVFSGRQPHSRATSALVRALQRRQLGSPLIFMLPAKGRGSDQESYLAANRISA